MLRRDGLRVRTIERRGADQHREQDAREAVDVARWAEDVLAARLLGTHVLGRAHHDAEVGERITRRSADPEVGDDGVPAGEQDVLGLDVAMHDAVLVCIAQRVGYLTREPHRFVDRKPSLAPDPAVKRLTLDVRHGEEDPSVRLAAVVQRQDVRVDQAARDADLAQEALDVQRRSDLLAQHLDRDRSLMADVGREIHRRHSAPAELPLDHVPAGEGVTREQRIAGMLLGLVQDLGHRTALRKRVR